MYKCLCSILSIIFSAGMIEEWHTPTTQLHQTAELPAEVPASQFAERATYYIRTRVIIDVRVFSIGDLSVTLFAAKPQDIWRQFRNTESLYKDLSIKFDIQEYVYRKCTQDNYGFLDAVRYPEYLSVYYSFADNVNLSGLSSMPWESWPWGILIFSNCDDQDWTLAHEIGHYFGLYHTFHHQGDLCDDTPEQSWEMCTTQNSCNCGNIMNYCEHVPKYVTSDQLIRMRRFLRSVRRNQIVEKPSAPIPMEHILNQLKQPTTSPWVTP